MNFDLKKPCKDCPFSRFEGAVRLTRGRVREVWRSVEGGPSFQCHKTVERDDEDEVLKTPRDQHCAGAIIAGLKTGHQGSQLAQVAFRLRILSERDYEPHFEHVVDDIDEMLARAIR